MSDLFGWCIDGLHADDEGGCPGRVGGAEGIACACNCHHEGDD